MWFIGVEVEQETSALPPKKKSWIGPCILLLLHRILTLFCAKHPPASNHKQIVQAS